MGGDVLGPKRLDGVHCVIHDRAALAKRNAERIEFGLGGPDGESCNQSAFGQCVEHGEFLCYRDGMAERDLKGGEAHFDARGRCRDHRGRGDGMEARMGCNVMVGQIDRVKSERLDMFAECGDLARGDRTLGSRGKGDANAHSIYPLGKYALEKYPIYPLGKYALEKYPIYPLGEYALEDHALRVRP